MSSAGVSGDQKLLTRAGKCQEIAEEMNKTRTAELSSFSHWNDYLPLRKVWPGSDTGWHFRNLQERTLIRERGRIVDRDERVEGILYSEVSCRKSKRGSSRNTVLYWLSCCSRILCLSCYRILHATVTSKEVLKAYLWHVFCAVATVAMELLKLRIKARDFMIEHKNKTKWALHSRNNLYTAWLTTNQTYLTATFVLLMLAATLSGTGEHKESSVSNHFLMINIIRFTWKGFNFTI